MCPPFDVSFLSQPADQPIRKAKESQPVLARHKTGEQQVNLDSGRTGKVPLIGSDLLPPFPAAAASARRRKAVKPSSSVS
jgi:hypothetical protein